MSTYNICFLRAIRKNVNLRASKSWLDFDHSNGLEFHRRGQVFPMLTKTLGENMLIAKIIIEVK